MLDIGTNTSIFLSTHTFATLRFFVMKYHYGDTFIAT